MKFVYAFERLWPNEPRTAKKYPTRIYNNVIINEWELVAFGWRMILSLERQRR